MSALDVLNRYGGTAFAKLVGAMALLLVLHLLKLPLVFVIRVLNVAMIRAGSIAALPANPPIPRHINITSREGVTHVHAA